MIPRPPDPVAPLPRPPITHWKCETAQGAGGSFRPSFRAEVVGGAAAPQPRARRAAMRRPRPRLRPLWRWRWRWRVAAVAAVAALAACFRCPLAASAAEGAPPAEEDACAPFRAATALQIFLDGRERLVSAAAASFPAWQKEEDLFRSVLQKLSAAPLQRALRGSPSSDAVLRALSVLQAGARPLRVAVYGGSVTWGTNCWTGVRLANFHNCAWPRRLQLLLDALLGAGRVEILSVAEGGTSSEAGSDLVLGRIGYPSASWSPDVVVNAYATNDMHFLSASRAASLGLPLQDHVRDAQERFVRASLRAEGACAPPPALVLFDDYVGNEQRGVAGTLAGRAAMDMLRAWYPGVGVVSYADAVREQVYRDTAAALFSPQWRSADGAVRRNVHPGSAAHMAMALVLLFAALSAAEDACGPAAAPAPPALPPPLRAAALANVSRDIAAAEAEEAALCRGAAGGGGGAGRRRACAFAFSSVGVDSAAELEARIGGALEAAEGWEVGMEHRKVGLLARAERAAARFLVEGAAAPGSALRVHYTTSYGAGWEGSAAAVRVEDAGGAGVLGEATLRAWHGMQTSVTYAEKVPLRRVAPVGASLRVTIEMVSGARFRLSGMWLCRGQEGDEPAPPAAAAGGGGAAA